MARKNPFDHSPVKAAVTTTPAGGDATKPPPKPVNPFARSKEADTAPKVRSAMGNVKAPGKSTIDKWQSIVAKKRAGLAKVVVGKKLTVVEPPKPATPTQPIGRSALGGVPGKSSMSGSGSTGQSNSSFGRDSQFARSGGTDTKSETPLSGTEYRKAWVIDTPDQASGSPNDPPKPPPTPMTSSNYADVYKEESLGIKGALTQNMTGENYAQIYKAQQGYIGDATEQVTSHNYVEVYKQREEIRIVREQVEQKKKQQEIAIIEIRKQEQKNAQLAGQAQGLYAKLAHLRGSLGRSPEQDASTYASIADTEAALARIPSGLR